jgi:hypothetical protein
MSLNSSRIYSGLLVVVLAVVTQACGVSQNSMPTAVGIPTQVQLSPTIPAADMQNRPQPETLTPTVEVMPSQTAPSVTVLVVNGDLSVRTGPDMSFDAIAKLKNGETVTALARSIMDGWVQIQIPSQSEKTGWISIQTTYSIVNGNVLDLPRVDSVEWNVGSYLLNCTTHQLIVQPGDTILQPVGNSPENKVWFPPGSYSIYDLEVSGQPVVANLNVLEHNQYTIRKDGNRQQFTCPYVENK